MNTHQSGFLLGTAALMLLMSGCATTHKVRTGLVYGGDLKPGYPCPDFTFIDENGRADTFSHIRGAVTLVVFPDDPEWPNCKRCREFVDLAAKLQRLDTPVVVVSIRSPGQPGRCPAAALHRCHVEGLVQLVALCDHQGRVRDLFGPNAIGQFFVVGPAGRIAGRGPLAEDLYALEASVRKAVLEHEHEVEWLRVAEDG